MKIQIVGLLALGLLVTAQPDAFAQMSPSTTTTQPANPRTNPDNDQSGPRSTEPRTDATPDASTNRGERMERGTMMDKNTMDKGKSNTMSKPKSGKTSDSMNKPRSGSMQGGSMSNSGTDITNTTNLPESKSRPDDALLVDPPSGYSNNDPNLKPRTDTQNPTTTRPK